MTRPPPRSGLPRTRQPPVPERAILAAVLGFLRYHRRVAWVERMNTGAARMGEKGGRYVRFGFPGCSDILGQLTDGRLLAVECKRAGAHPTVAQSAFLDRVAASGGLAFVARSVEDASRALGAMNGRP